MHLVRESPSKSWNVGIVYRCCCKSYGLLGESTNVLVAADDTVPAQLITLILLTNLCYTKMAKRKIICVHCT